MRVVRAWACVTVLVTSASYASAVTEDCLAPSDSVALQGCSIAARQLSHDIVALRALGHELEIRGRHSDALDVYRIGLDIHPQNRELLTRSIRARSNVRAWRLLDDAPHPTPVVAKIKRDPAAEQCYALRFSQALPACRAAVQRAPQDAALHGRLGDVLRSVGRVDDAIAAYTLSDQFGDTRAARKRAVLHRLVNAIGRQPPLVANTVPYVDAVPPVAPPTAQTPSMQSVSQSRNLPSVLARGVRRALIIGNQQYQHFETLQTPRADVDALADMLQADYGFADVQRLFNATRYEMLSALSTLRTQTTSDDQVLIYYAGHGYLDPVTSRGYWLPVDAQKNNLANWLSTSDITDTLAGLAAQHAMVIADSCFSGSLLRAGGTVELDERSTLLQRLAERRSRTIMTSGGLEPVVDDGGGRHSAFANALLAALGDNTGVLEAGRLFVQVRDRVALQAEQTPQYAPVRGAGHDGGDFLFVRHD